VAHRLRTAIDYVNRARQRIGTSWNPIFSLILYMNKTLCQVLKFDTSWNLIRNGVFRNARCGTYLKGWGFMVVPASRVAVSRSVHISAPHPGYDLGTVEQAASIFENTGSKSLLVPGRTRTAFLKSSDCIVPVSARQDYFMTDPAHNNVRFFR
jgi:hypothetical protein